MYIQNKKLLLTTGGTGGHVFPGLVVADFLVKKANWQILWLGTKNNIEAYLVPKHGIKIEFITVSSICNANFKKKLISIMRIFKAIKDARNIISIWKPDVVLSMGGYVSFPGSLAAWSYGIPLILHEQNAVIGFTNRILSKISCKTLQAFSTILNKKKEIGNPIRNSILSILPPDIRLCNRNGPIRILVIGGSQGSQIINKIVPLAINKVIKKLNIWHQTGIGKLNGIDNIYSKINGLKYNLTEFIDDISVAYEWADLIICRSGALTVSEISIVGVAAIFIPFIHKDQQQYHNALILEKVGAAKVIKQLGCPIIKIANFINKLNREKLLFMAKQAKSVAIYNSTENIVKELMKIVS